MARKRDATAAHAPSMLDHAPRIGIALMDATKSRECLCARLTYSRYDAAPMYTSATRALALVLCGAVCQLIAIIG